MEEWKDILGYEGKYQVSNLGRVKSLQRISYGNKSLNEKILKSSLGKWGESRVILYYDGVGLLKIISRLVAQHFIPNPLNFPCACHIDETLDENGALYNGMENLWWGTQKQNIQDMYRKGRSNNHFIIKNPMKGKFGNDHIRGKKVSQYTKNGEFIKTWGSVIDASQELNINKSHISQCSRIERKTAGGFIWKYL